MNVSSRIWVATFAALVFVTGVSVGVLVDRTWLSSPQAIGPAGFGWGGGAGGGRTTGPGGPSTDSIVSGLDAELHFSDAQRTAIAGILEAQRPGVQQLQIDARARFLEEQQRLQDDIAQALTPEQAERFRALMAERGPGALGQGGQGRGRGPGAGMGGPGGSGRRGAGRGGGVRE